jgi:hypothetical protein
MHLKNKKKSKIKENNLEGKWFKAINEMES